MNHYIEILKGPGRGHRLSLFEGESFIGGVEGGEWMLQSAPLEQTNFKVHFEEGELTLTAYDDEATFWLNEEYLHRGVIADTQIVKFNDCILQYRVDDGKKPVVRFGKLSALQFVSIVGISTLMIMQLLVMLVFSWSWRAEDELGALLKAELLEASLAPAEDALDGMDDLDAELEMLSKMEVPETPQEEVKEPEQVEAEELTEDRAQRMLDDGVKLWRERQLAEAERQFKRILQMDNAYVPAMVELAKLHQFRGMSDEALGYWNRVIEQGRDSEFYFKAVSEKSRIEQEQKRESFARGLTEDKKKKSQTASPSEVASKFDKYRDVRPAAKAEAPPKEAKPPVVQQTNKKSQDKKTDVAAVPEKPRAIKPEVNVQKPQVVQPKKPDITKPIVTPPSRPVLVIESTDVQRYLKNERFDEMRLLTVVLQSKSTSDRLAGKDFTVKVTFFDKDTQSGATEQTQVLVPDPSVKLEGRILPDDSPTVSFAYVVQKGYRDVQKTKTKKSMTYHGYLVEVYYRGRLIDRVGVPKSLAK